ncbi:Tyrosine-protein phosphatase 2-like protein [Cladobotryum mycophilum]|uniref:Tyrosine-protein phosphatase 2-like protein n=1 Tax=Cladobotryum mycophilum TaxID=491253 RepID=A0ABR0SUH2_9HYPO
MDKLPKFRRKPKPPAIETSVGRNMGDTAQQIAAAGNQVTSPPQLQHPQKPSKIAALRNLRLRGTAKRARDDPPAELPTSPPPAVVTQDGMSPRRVSRPIVQPEQKPDRNKKNGHLPPPKLPGFLTLSTQEIENKFQEITWAERNRLAQGLRNENIPDYPWTLYKQEDTQQRGVMDRYVNIRPWSHNRVKLRVPQNELDYVNASTVILKSPSDKTKPPLRYIAMQGPTEPSFDYVWRMIAEQISSPAVIVQLTSMFEAGAPKCDQYFPFDEDYAVWDLNEDNLWGENWKAQLTYDSLEELSSGAIEKRKLLLHVEGEKQPRVIWHLLYRRWPDFGVPTLEDLDSFFDLMKLSRKLSNPTSPRIVHCSAGVGRTGTFISLEHLIRELESGALERYDSPREGPDLIYDTVDILRQQRRAMVQADVQYKFIYQVMRKLWQDKYGLVDEDAGSSEPAAKRLEVVDPYAGHGVTTGPGPDVGAGIIRTTVS